MFNLSIFAERLAELMFDNNINAPKLAKALGISSTTITRYLALKRVPTLPTIILIADYFNCTIDFLLGIENEIYQTKFKPCPPFSERLAYLFKHFGKTKVGLRDEKEISESIIFSWLRGDVLPTPDNLIKLAEYFNCSIDYVVGRE
ncbi:MAG: XRE family transcriptional regulator [Bacteroides sp.]|nr:XRE family transcriptional regulator [Bacillota bacterium]MCM1393914.1 XRE family transcriptional regulator [[Eubacterium] siraeum]MCM1456002.1 XRE family transcriptional regulator [Bacteroides sp.]